MFGIGVGMLYTPILVDRLQLEFPSGHAVANILRALTDKRLLRRSIGKLGGGTGAGIAIAALVSRVAWLERIGISASTVGAGLIVGSRIGVPALVMGGVGELLVPRLRAAGYLGPHDPFRKIGFLVGLAMIMGAAVVDLAVIGREAVRRVQARRGAARAPVPSGGLSSGRLLAWVIVWGVALVLVATLLLGQPVGYVLFALALVFLFVFVNGISTGISDWNPISSAFVVSVLMMSALGLRSPIVAMMAASILLVSTTVGVDMQQDRSTGWRLGSNRAIQFRYQAVGIVVGSVLCVVMAQLFMTAYPILRVDTFTHPEARVGGWQSAMTFKFVGAIRGMGHLRPYQVTALWLGFGIGFGTEVLRKLHRSAGRPTAASSPRARRRRGRRLDGRRRAALEPLRLVDGRLPRDLDRGLVRRRQPADVAALPAPRSAAVAPEENGDALPEDMSTAVADRRRPHRRRVALHAGRRHRGAARDGSDRLSPSIDGESSFDSSCTHPRWFAASAADLRALLSDHLHCERKAAENALSLVRRYPHRGASVAQLSRLAHEETSHVVQVAALLGRRGWTPRADSPNHYARGLMDEVRGREPERLLDALLVAAFIEARSHERLGCWRADSPPRARRSWPISTRRSATPRSATPRSSSSSRGRSSRRRRSRRGSKSSASARPRSWARCRTTCRVH